MPKVSIVIPTYNHCEDLLKPCCESIIANTDMSDVEVIVVANGCTDGTEQYIESLGAPFKIIVHSDPLGYTKATNVGILAANSEFVVLLNNDCVILSQARNLWIHYLLEPFKNDDKAGITGPLKSFCNHAKREFMIFFCVMIRRSLFDELGLLDIMFSPGGGEDTDFSIRAQDNGYKIVQVPGDDLKTSGGLMIGVFPIYHAGEKTVGELSNWRDIFDRNSHYLAKRYDPNYRYELTNGFERAVYLKYDQVVGLELTRYKWATENMMGNTMLEVGSTSGYGSQFFPTMDYTGLDYEKKISNVSRWEFGDKNHKFVHGDINTFDLKQYDTIVAFEVIEHLDNGFEIVEKLKKHCKNLLITVPYKEPQGFWGHHHKLFGIDESRFKDFDIKYIDANANILDQPNPGTFNLMIMRYQRPRILCSISTKNRYDNYLPMTIMSVINQTVLPNHLIIYDDNDADKAQDIRTLQVYQHIFQLLAQKGISWELEYGQRRGVSHNHQRANTKGFDWVWRLDDDCFAEPTVLERLAAHIEPGVGAIGGSILTPGTDPSYNGPKSSSIDGLHLPNKQWFKIEEKQSVEHLNCSFLYRAGVVDYNLNLSPKSFREETMFTYGLKLKGYDILIIPDCVTYDFHAKGGIR